MNEPGTYPQNEIDRLLVEHFDREAADRRAAFVRSDQVDPGCGTTSCSFKFETPSAALAAVVGGLLNRRLLTCELLGVLAFRRTLRRSPQALLQETQKTLQEPVYRCYLIEVQRETDQAEDANSLAANLTAAVFGHAVIASGLKQRSPISPIAVLHWDAMSKEQSG